jgi:hypothetical protein
MKFYNIAQGYQLVSCNVRVICYFNNPGVWSRPSSMAEEGGNTRSREGCWLDLNRIGIRPSPGPPPTERPNRGCPSRQRVVGPRRQCLYKGACELRFDGCKTLHLDRYQSPEALDSGRKTPLQCCAIAAERYGIHIVVI